MFSTHSRLFVDECLAISTSCILQHCLMAMVSISDSNLLPFFFHQLTPLHRAARRGHRNIVEYFVQKGAGIDNGDNEQVSESW